jgi:hypothetical protein
MWRKRVMCVVAVCAGCVTVAGCGGASKADAGPARVVVTPAESLENQPVHITIRGLAAHQDVSLNVTSVDARGVRWTSTEGFQASGSGVVDVDRAAGRTGSYVGVWGMGSIAMMHATSHSSAGAYFWPDSPQRFAATVTAHGRTLGATSLGVSRGSEAAQLTGADYRSLANAVIALVPSDVALCSYPGCGGPAWTLHGRAIPFTRQFKDPAPTDQPAAVIPDQRIHGPVFLACAGKDTLWPSCPYAHAILRHLNAAHDPFPHPLYTYPNAGHGVGAITPYEPTQDYLTGESPQADQQAQAQDWPRLLQFLAAFSHS